MPPLLGIVAGMEAEAAALGQWRDDPRVSVAISAGRPAQATREAERLVGLGVSALLSWGIAGGLDPDLSSGDLLIADGVIAPGGRPFAFEQRLITACREALADPASCSGGRQATPFGKRRGSALISARALSASPLSAQTATDTARFANLHLLAGSEIVVLKSAAKAALRRRSAAHAVDMETHRVAAIARDAGLPCIAIRAISDPANRNLPALVAHALDGDGRPRIAEVLRGLAIRPWALPGLIRAGRDSGKALDALSSRAAFIIPALLARLSD